MIDIEKICSISTDKMLRIAIHEHHKRFHGKLPKRIEMHPSVYSSLKIGIEELILMETDSRYTSKSYYGVPILIDLNATRLKLINTNNEVEYI